MDPVTIRNPESDLKVTLGSGTLSGKNVIRFIKYPCSLKYGTGIGKSGYERAISTGTVTGYLMLCVLSHV